MSEKYQHLEFYDAQVPPEPEEVAAIEALLGAKLPEDFLEFLNVANGAVMDNCLRVPPDGKVVCFNDVFLAGKDKDGKYGYDSFIRQIEIERESKEIPGGVLPFGGDGAHGVIYLDLTPEGKGRVVASLAGYPVWGDNSQEDKFIEIAPGFAAYIELLFDSAEAYSSQPPSIKTMSLEGASHARRIRARVTNSVRRLWLEIF